MKTSVVAIALSSLLFWLAADSSRVEAQCGDVACVHTGTAAVTVSQGQTSLLNSMFTSLSGATIDLSTPQYQSLANAQVNLQELGASVVTNGLAGSADVALTTPISLSEAYDAVADALRARGNSAAAAVLDSLALSTDGVTGDITLGSLLTGDTSANVMTQSNVNALDLVNALVATQDEVSGASTRTVSTTGLALGLGTVGAVELTFAVLDSPVFVCGSTGAKFYSAAIRLRVHVTLANTNQGLNVGIASLNLALNALDLVVGVSRASGTLTAINVVQQSVTLQVTPGLAELYLGTISDAKLTDRSGTPINPETDLGYAVIGNVTATVLGLSASASIEARAYALGTNPAPTTLMFTGPYPQTRTATTSATFVNTLVTTLVNSLSIRVSAFVGPLDLGTLLTGVLTAVVNTLKTLNNGLLSNTLTTVLGGVVDPLLTNLGLGLGRADVTVDRVFNIPPNTTCDDGMFCTVGDKCSATNQCTGTMRSCEDSLSCTNNVCNEGTDQCVSTVTTGCAINGACYASAQANPANQCQACTPGTSPTTWSNKNSGASCDDGAYCTTGDACNGTGVCESATRDCADGLTCTSDGCDETNDKCTHALNAGFCTINNQCIASGTTNPDNQCQHCNTSSSTTAWSDKAQGAGCSDNLFCTINDACDGAGNCRTTARDCGDAFGCTLDVCNEGLRICTNLLSNLACKIGNLCYGSGTTNPANPCQVCDPTTLGIGWTNRPNGTSCSDGSNCTVSDSCTLGLCLGQPRVCNDGLACTTEICNPLTDKCEVLLNTGCSIDGQCVLPGTINPENPCQVCTPSSSTTAWTNAGEGASCDDGLFCTEDDTCDEDNVCVGEARNCGIGTIGCSVASCDEVNNVCNPVATGCDILGTCYPAGAINPLNRCQECVPGTFPTGWTSKADGASCVDNQYCTVGETCTAGLCTFLPRSCGNNLGCSLLMCNEGQDRCDTVLNTGCVIEGMCHAGLATNPDNECEFCDPLLNPTGWSPKLLNPVCDDDLNCTVDDRCDGTGVCAGTPRDCSTGFSCSSGTCNEESGECVEEISGCLIDDDCYVANQVNPANPCEYCDAAKPDEWSNAPMGATCSDGAYCTVGDACNGSGNCGTEMRSCEDTLGCTNYTCNEVFDNCDLQVAAGGCAINGACFDDGMVNPLNTCEECNAAFPTVWTPKLVGDSCNDGKFCTSNDLCTVGAVCAGTGSTCNDSLLCTLNTCDEAADECQVAVNVGCAIDDVCYALGDRRPGSDCEECNPSISKLEWSNSIAGTTCSDGLFCTVNACDGSGDCIAAPRDCNDGLDCTDDECDEGNQRCAPTPIDSCVIDDTCYGDTENDPENDCRTCDPETSTSDWTDRGEGEGCIGDDFCKVNQVCDANAVCGGGDDRDCDDEVGCSMDMCDSGAKECLHLSIGGCVVDDTCVSATTINTSNACQVCDPARAESAWSIVQSDYCLGEEDPDHDGFVTRIECPLGIAMCPDTDEDGTLDYLDPDDDGDTVLTLYEHAGPNTFDTDGDQRVNHLDPDDDNDTLLTRDERPDGNGDGQPDDALDTDSDEGPDYLDEDDDQDSILTIEERQDALEWGDDVDGDETLNWHDTDSDNDTLSDNAEYNNGDGDVNDDNTPDYLQSPDPDAGTDAGTDGGTDAAVDAGTDAGTDAGMDSGTTPVPDGGKPPVDGGKPSIDTGGTGGSSARDSGASGYDAEVPDAGVADAGETVTDSGSAADAGEKPTPSPRPNPLAGGGLAGGSRCTVSTTPGDTAGWSCWLLLGAAFVLGTRRARRRQPRC